MDWDYKALGFTSQEEMNQSIARVKAAKKAPTAEIKQRIENKNRLANQTKESGRLDINAIAEGARLNELDRIVASKLYQEEQRAKAEKRAEALNELMKKTGETTKLEDEQKAQKAIEEETERVNKEIRDKHLKDNNLLTEKEERENKFYSEVLKKLSR